MHNTDFMIAGYPKSGNTWLQHILFRKLIGPEYDSDKAIELIKPNKIMYRTEGTEKPGRNKLVYIMRHPLDVLVSYRNYEDITGRNHVSFDNYVKGFLNKGGVPGRVSWAKHVEHWSNYTDCIIKYDDLMFRGEETLKVLFTYLDLPLGDELEVLEDVSFDKLRKKEDVQAAKENWKYFEKQRPTDISAIKNNKRFYNVGKSFYFNEILSEDQVQQGFKVFNSSILKYWPNEELTERYLK